MKTKLKIIILIVPILIISSIVFVYALLQQSKEYEEINFKLGYIDVTLSGSLVSDNYIYPGLNLIDEPYKLINNSTIEIDLKIIIVIKIDNREILPTEYLEDGFIELNGAVINGNEYMISNITDEEIILIESLTLNGFIVRNDYSNLGFEVYINYQVKQSSHATWEDVI